LKEIDMQIRTRVLFAAAMGLSLLISGSSRATLIDFDDGSVSATDTLANQYAGLGVTFAAGTGGASGVPNTAITTQGFSTNTNMTIVSSTGGDVGSGVGTPISGLMLHSFAGWVGEDGDSVFRINFATPISSISIDFGGVFDTGVSGIHAVDGSNTVIGSAFATSANTSTVSLTPTSAVSSIVVTEGDFDDWVGVDNINFQFVPEPASLSALLPAVLAIVRRRRR
jgi:hypothetical protein